jgi:hypothetical protein
LLAFFMGLYELLCMLWFCEPFVMSCQKLI